MRIEIYWTRHGYSRANCYGDHMSWIRSRYQKTFDVDPPLTKKGIADIKVYRKRLEFLKGIDCVCSSTMLRAIQTAQHLLPGRDIHVVPFVKEDGSDGECTPSSISQQSHYFDFDAFRHVDYQFVDSGRPGKFKKIGYEGDYDKFIDWLEKHVYDLMDLSGVPREQKVFKILLISHSVYMERNLCDSKTCDRPYNVGTVKKNYLCEDGVIERSKFPMITQFRMTEEEIKKKGACEGVISRGIPPPTWEELKAV